MTLAFGLALFEALVVTGCVALLFRTRAQSEGALDAAWRAYARERGFRFERSLASESARAALRLEAVVDDVRVIITFLLDGEPRPRTRIEGHAPAPVDAIDAKRRFLGEAESTLLRARDAHVDVEGGTVRAVWPSAETNPWVLDAAIAAIVAACRVRPPTSLYR